MEKDSWSVMWIVIADIVIVLVMGFLAWKISLWALLGLFFLFGSTSKIIITLKDGTVIEAKGNEAIEKVEEIRREITNGKN